MGGRPSPELDHCVKALVADGLIAPLPARTSAFFITEHGLDCLKITCKPKSGHPCYVPRDLPLSDMTTMELALRLCDGGWSKQEWPLRKRPPPLLPNGPLVWCDREPVYSKYLLCLLKATDLFTGGAAMIHHGQASAYYDALLTLPADKMPQLNALPPNQKAETYNALLGRSRVANTVQQALTNPVDDLEEDDALGIHEAANGLPAGCYCHLCF